MKYFYEYKEKNGATVGGHNLENILVKGTGKYIILQGVDIKPIPYDYDVSYWSTRLDMNTIEYLKITPMGDEE